ncbi:mitotic-spindle organizing protein 2B-like [Tubulanus polymorphus]|uniref:mitotic-spindle organizing protein 2B-like n=1 Tax=Tubulanus polymorphus TaxID=672921 RepID=UPI003DA54898
MTTPTPQAQIAKSQTMKFTLLSKNVLSADEAELYELGHLAGVVMDPNLFKIVLDLLKMNIAPTVIMQMLKSIRNQKRAKKDVASRSQSVVTVQSAGSMEFSGNVIKRIRPPSRARSEKTDSDRS